MIHIYSHQSPLYCTDNNAVWSYLEEATRNTPYGATVKAFAKSKDGRAAFLAITTSHAGDDKWETIQKYKNAYLQKTKWNGRTYSLEKFTNHHRAAFVMLQEAKEHVDFQFPTEHTHVTYLLDNIDNNDPDLLAALSNIRADINAM
mmetsp:Transcript_19836/g.27898  ORF Transcript_19836/g.27898 Transcript_19836/m.27898 type:complete len:146 (+) Transcript_19836:905-1342(+)